MSSTSRGSSRQPSDFYRTPSRCTKIILPHLRWDKVADVLDPAAGDGAIMRVVEQNIPGGSIVLVRGIELDPERAAMSGSECADALQVDWGEPDIVIMNQPYSFAIEFCEKALTEVRHGGDVAALMRTSMVCSDEREEFWAKHPADVFHIKRPSFTEHLRYSKERGEVACRQPLGKNGKCRRPLGHVGECATCGTDSCDYAWFVWGEGRGNRWWRLDKE